MNETLSSSSLKKSLSSGLDRINRGRFKNNINLYSVRSPVRPDWLSVSRRLEALQWKMKKCRE